MNKVHAAWICLSRLEVTHPYNLEIRCCLHGWNFTVPCSTGQLGIMAHKSCNAL